MPVPKDFSRQGNISLNYFQNTLLSFTTGLSLSKEEKANRYQKYLMMRKCHDLR